MLVQIVDHEDMALVAAAMILAKMRMVRAKRLVIMRDLLRIALRP